MSMHRTLSKEMLHAYLYSTHNVAERLVQTHTRALRNNNSNSDPPKTHTTPTQQTSKDKKKDETAVRKLEADMNKRTDLVLLRDARAYQQGELGQVLVAAAGMALTVRRT